MLLLCDPAAAVTADIVEFTRARTVAHYTGTAGDLFAQFTTGAPARTEEQARQHLADMLLLCDPAAAVTADIVEFTRARTVAHYTGTAGDLFAQFTTGAPARTVIARRLTSDTTTPTAGQR